MNPIVDYIMGALIISFFMRITLAIIKTILYDKHISSDLLIGCLAGYMMIGICGFLLFGMLDTYVGFDGFKISTSDSHVSKFSILYYSFVTLLTIGYGDVVPVSSSLQLVTIIYSLIGRSYSTFILAMILKKFDSKYL
jgi:voltage-gated potassium channel